MKFLASLLAFPLAVIIVIFAVVNRQAVTVDLWPLPWEMDVPLYLMVLGALALGLIIGGLVSWFSAGSTRSQARREHKRVVTLEREVQTLQEEKTRLEKRSTEQKALPAE